MGAGVARVDVGACSSRAPLAVVLKVTSFWRNVGLSENAAKLPCHSVHSDVARRLNESSITTPLVSDHHHHHVYVYHIYSTLTNCRSSSSLSLSISIVGLYGLQVK